MVAEPGKAHRPDTDNPQHGPSQSPARAGDDTLLQQRGELHGPLLPAAADERLHSPSQTGVRQCPSVLGRFVLRLLALFSLFLGLLGVIVPGMPTTVFVLIAAWAAARSSPRLHGWLYRHRLFGSIIRNWEAGGFVSRKAKYMATLTMLACAAIMVLTGVVLWALLLACACMTGVSIWLWLRPEPPASLPPAPPA